MNVFEGARRVSKVVMLLWVLGVAGIAYSDYHDELIYGTKHPGDPFVLVATCEHNAHEIVVYRSFMNNSETRVVLCFAADPEDRQIAYEAVKGEKDWYTIGERFSPEVQQYVKQRGESFKLDPQDAAARATLSSRRWKAVRDAALIIVGGLVVLYVCQLALGWVVRGFAGIPTGQDSRS